MFEAHVFKRLQYLIHYPEGYEKGQKLPVFFLFHGSGSRGCNLNMIKTNCFFEITKQYKQFSFITVAPQCHENTWYDLWETVKELVEEVTAFDCCDSTRVYAIGPSMGGYATWQIAMSMPQYFAAIVPMCGGGMYWNGERLRDVPAWAFHGQADEIVKVEESIKMVDGVNAKGGKAKLTIYPKLGHEIWEETYSNPDVFAWVLSQRKEVVW